MTIKASGSLSFSQIRAEFPSNLSIGQTPDSLGEFDGMVLYKPSTGRQFIIPSDPSFSDFYGVSWSFQIDVLIIGGGGGGGGIVLTTNGGFGRQTAGGGGGGRVRLVTGLTVTPGQSYSVRCGAAGNSGAGTGARGGSGAASFFSSYRAAGGGGGGGYNNINGGNGSIATGDSVLSCGGGAHSFGSGGTGGRSSTTGDGGDSRNYPGFEFAASREGGGGGGWEGDGQIGEFSSNISTGNNGNGGAGYLLSTFMGNAAYLGRVGYGGGGGYAVTGRTTGQAGGYYDSGTNTYGGYGRNAYIPDSSSLERRGHFRSGGGGGGGAVLRGGGEEGGGDGGGGAVIVRYHGSYRRDTSSGTGVEHRTGTIGGQTYQFIIFGRSNNNTSLDETFSVNSNAVFV